MQNSSLLNIKISLRKCDLRDIVLSLAHLVGYLYAQ